MRTTNILTFDDLLQFCIKNNFTSFSSKKSGYSLHVSIPCESFELEDSSDEIMLFANVRLMHTGKNRNMSNLTENAAKKCMSKIAYKPILADFTDINGERDFTYHAIQFNDDGSRTYIERQVGCFTSDKPYMEQDPNREDRKYIYVKAAIPREYTDAADIIERKGGTKISAELSINEMSYSIDEGLLLEDVEVMGATLLGTDPETGKQVNEGMENSFLQIEDFSAENNSFVAKSELIEEITAEVLSRLDNKQANINSHYTIRKEEIGNMDNENSNIELNEEDIETEVKQTEVEEVESTEDIEDEVPVVENESSDEENVEPNEAFEGDESSEESEDEPVTDDGVLNNSQQGKRTYSINGMSFEVSISQIQQAITELINDQYSESDNDYYFVEIYQDSKTVVMSGMFSGRSYRQGYKVRNDVYSLVGSRVPVKAVFVTADEEAELDRMRSNYSSIEEKLQKYESEPEKMEILNSSDYANIADQADFAELKKQENHFDLTVDELKEKADAMLLQYAKSGKLNFAEVDNKPEEHKKDFFAFAKSERNTSFLDGLLKQRK